MKKIYYSTSMANYAKALERFHKNVQTGRFAIFTKHKRRQIWSRLCRYARQLGITVKAPVAAASLLVGLTIATSSTAQIYVERTGAANPLNIDVGSYAAPTFVDIDNDGDMDAFIGEYYGTIRYFKNNGTNSAPIFAEQTGLGNPLNFDVGYLAVPVFIDIDNDGDKDAFIGSEGTGVSFYRNTGTPTTPGFNLVTGVSNPLNSVSGGTLYKPVFIDIDNDGDADAFVAMRSNITSASVVRYFKNNGTPAAPIMAEETGITNPLNGVSKSSYDSPAFADVDADGDKDFFLGSNPGPIYYYRNTGNSTSPVFVEQAIGNNPLGGATGSTFPVLTFVDIDNDSDMDSFIATSTGIVRYYINNAIVLPLQLLSFTVKNVSGYNQVGWQTADEATTKEFQVESSNDGLTFTPVASIKAGGNNGNKYAAIDNQLPAGKIFYRLKMIDVDGKVTYSQLIWTGGEQGNKIIVYPNPVVNFVNINIGRAKLQNTEAGIYDAAGKLQQKFRITNIQQQVPVKSLSKGLFVIKFADGSSERFIKN